MLDTSARLLRLLSPLQARPYRRCCSTTTRPVAVAVGLRTAASGSVAGIQETSVHALAKLEQVLPSRLADRYRRATR